jgi:hypothetical protein
MPKLCEFETCRNRAVYGLNSNPIMCKQHKTDQMKLSCQLCPCGKQPFFNFKDMTPKFCSVCKLDGMIDVKNTKCFCGKSQPRFNYEGQKPIFCNSCKEEDMINLLFKKCKCGKRARYNYPELKSEYCTDCKSDGMVDCEKKRCKCGVIATFNFEGKKPEFCKKCKKDNMIDLCHEKCKCGKARPTFNFEGLKAEYCASCKKVDMINLKDDKCICGKSVPCFNYIGLKAQYCASCKKDEMTNVKDKMCYCGKCYPTFNFEGLKSEYCSSCKKEGMINVKDERCKAENCLTRGNKNYKGYCVNCFQHLFPTDPLTFQIRSKTKEIAVRDFINSRFEGFQHDKPLWYNETTCDCTSKRRIDHRKLINDTLLCIETDENQHKSYSKEDEIARYNDLFMGFGGKFIFIRFNPDKYKDNGKSCNPMLVNRLPVLESEINKQIKRIESNENTELLEVFELYYDKNN